MKALIQRVKKASVTIDGTLYSEISNGLLIFLGVTKGDNKENAQKLAEKILKFRIFEDENGKMNKSVSDLNYEILVVSQFTLCADTKKGTRPSFDNSESPEIAKELYEYFVNYMIKTSNLTIKTGQFQSMMDISLINNGPVTFNLEK